MKINYSNIQSDSKIKYWRSLILLLVIFMTAWIPCDAQIADKDTILILLQQEKPYAYKDTKGKTEGYFPEIIDSIFHPLNQPYKIILKDGENEQRINDSIDVRLITEESPVINDEKAELSWIIFHTVKGLLYRKGLPINKLSDIQLYKTGVFFKDIFLYKTKMMGIDQPENNIIEIKSVWDALKLVDKKEIDAIVTDYTLLNWLMKHLEFSQSSKYNLIKISALPITYRLAVHPENSYISLDKINKQIEHLKRTGTLQTIYYKWHGNDDEEHVNRLKGSIQDILYILFAVFFVLIIVAIVIYQERKKQAGFYNDFTNILMHLPHAVDIFEDNNPMPVFQNNRSLELAQLTQEERNSRKYNKEYIDFKKDDKAMHMVVKVDVTEIEKERQIAEKSEKLKNAFLANMSHDIRTPLSAVVGFSSMIAEAENEAQLKEYSEIISSNTEYLLTLIDEIIHLSQLQTNTNKGLKRTEFDVIKMLYEMKAVFDNELKKVGRESDVEIVIDTPFDSLRLWMDGNRARRLTSNLISNACKYTETGRITVTVNYSQETGIFHAECKDTGIGIPSDKVKDVFTPYTRVDKNRDKGFGLGLAICKAIINTVNGDIKVESTEGVGTNVIVSFTPQVTGYKYKKQHI